MRTMVFHVFITEYTGFDEMDADNKNTETIVLCEVADKDGWKKEHNPGMGAHPKKFISRRGIKMPLGSTARIRNEDDEIIEELREKAREAGLSGTIQVRRAYGGVGSRIVTDPKTGKHKLSASMRHRIKTGEIDTSKTGFPIILDELEV